MLQHEGVTLSRSGILTITKWVYDEVTEEGQYVTSDVSISDRSFWNCLDEIVEFNADVTLGSIFALLASDILPDRLLYNYMFNNCYTLEFIEYYNEHKLTAPPYSTDGADAIEFLEVYRSFEQDSETEWMTTPMNLVSFHGTGLPSSEDGTRTNYGISYCDPQVLFNTPLRLNTAALVYEDNHGIVMKHIIAKTPVPHLFNLNANYTLRQVLYGILWELSWGGGPLGGKTIIDNLHNTTEETK